MKRIFTVLFATMLFTAALAVNASASDYDAVAEDLAAIGMFRGTASGFELDRAPTRSEAAIMLVRLYGAEEQAAADYEAGTISHPFTDVSDTAAPYVAYLYTNGIVNGTSAATYGSANACSAQNYVVFLLRALGYKDGTDFAYADALTFAQSKGFYNSMMFAGDFLRDDLAAVTYQALGTDLKDGSTYLLDSLITSGAIDKEAAAPLTEKIEAYRSLVAASADGDNTSMDVDLNVTMDLTTVDSGETTKDSMTMTGNMKMIMDKDDIQMAYEITTALDGEEMTVSTWLKDGWMYVQTEAGEEVSKVKSELDLEDQLAALGGLDTSMLSTSVDGLAMLDDISMEKKGADTVYTLVMGDAVGGYMDSVLGLMGDAGLDLRELGIDIELGDITAVYTVGRDGQLKDIKLTYAMTMNMLDGEGKPDATSSMTVAYDMDMSINAIGGRVKITYPDFSDFAEPEIPEVTPEPAA